MSDRLDLSAAMEPFPKAQVLLPGFQGALVLKTSPAVLF